MAVPTDTPLDANDLILVTRENSDGVGEPGGITQAALLADYVPNNDPAASIADVTVTGTYADDDDAIELAINSIIAVLLANGLIEAPA